MVMCEWGKSHPIQKDHPDYKKKIQAEVSSVGMAAAFSARQWVPYAGRAWVRILVVLDSESNLSDLPVPVHS